MKLKKNDKVLVISGKDKGKTGKVTRVVTKHEQVVVEKVNIRTKHLKKQQGQAGQIIRYEAPISAANVMILDPSNNKPTRIAYKKLDNGKKERISKLTGISLDNLSVESESKEETKEAPKKKASTKSKKTIKA
ncbi:MAG TPA: 50S ribosomal protein L24 [Candidatus Gracilibacteria bacterium]|nr:50S ribosomal protein L24 [Candidatus Gracilibacteria bacterium]